MVGRPRAAERRNQGGFTYLVLLLAIAVMGIGLVAASEVWVSVARRQKMAQLEWVGAQFLQGLGSYYDAAPGAARVYPVDLQDLLEDRRHLGLRRHLRTVYPNPFTGKADWEKVTAPDGRVRGVRAHIPLDGGGEEVREFVHVPPPGA